MTADAGVFQDKKIHELNDIYDERNDGAVNLPDAKKKQQVVVIDGRGYENVHSDSQTIHDLTEIVEDDSAFGDINELALKRALERIEKIAREAILDIAESVIREEMEKIKKMNKRHLKNQD